MLPHSDASMDESKMSKEFIVGEPYFLLNYLDEEFRFLNITSLIFIGKNLEVAQGETDLWFFQDAESYLKSGPYDGTGKEAPESSVSEQVAIGQVFDFPEAQLPNIVTMQELIAELGN